MSDGPGSPVLVLNSGSSSVKFALIRPGTGERLMAGMGERLGTPEAVVRLQTFAEPAVSERLPDGSHREAVARVLEHMTAALDGGVARPGRVTGWCTAESGSLPRSRWTTRLSPHCAPSVIWRRCTTRRISPASRQSAPYCPTCRKSPCSTRPFIRQCRRTARREPAATGRSAGPSGRHRWAGGGTCRKPAGTDSFSWARLAGVGDSHWKCICSGPMVSSTGR